MRWLADECVAAPLVARLREAGHDVLYMAETDAGASDAQTIAFAHSEARLLLTEDKDFGELVFRWRRPVPGVVLLRVAPDQPTLRSRRLLGAVDHYGAALFGRYTVIEAERTRSRALSI